MVLKSEFSDCFLPFELLVHPMIPEGYQEYRSREFCRDVGCPVQRLLDTKEKGSEEYERIREICKQGCLHSAREFHYWLIDHGYLIVRPKQQP